MEGRTLRSVAATAAAILLAFTACARQGVPSGGAADRIPPVVVSTKPDTFEIVEPFTSAVEIEFNERISERVSGGMNNAVEVSPRTGEVRVRHRRSGLRISVAGGFREGQVYRITVLPVVADMFNNQLLEPFEFLFSTGPEFTRNALAGVLTDRITGDPVPAVRVDAWQDGRDSMIHTTRSDQDGIFALRTIPVGRYDIHAYVDVNSNFEPNFIEPQAQATGQEVGVADTVLVFMEMLLPDTTAAELLSVDALDSMSLEVGFDDHLDPDSVLDEVSVSLSREDGDAPAVARLFPPHEWTEFLAARADSIAAVEAEAAAAEAAAAAAEAAAAAAEAAEAAADTTAAPPSEEPADVDRGPPPAEAAPLPIRPSQLFYALLQSPLIPGAVYTVAVSGVTNLNGLGDGGGEADVTGPEPPPPPPPVDSLETAPDSTGTVADTTAAAADTAAATPPDSAAADPVLLGLRRLRD